MSNVPRRKAMAVAVALRSLPDSRRLLRRQRAILPARMPAVQVAVLLPDTQSSTRWETADRPFLAKAFQKAGLTYSIVNAQGKASTQQTQAEQAITNGAKVILLVDLDSGSGAAIEKNAVAHGVKVIDYDRLTLRGRRRTTCPSTTSRSVSSQGQDLVKCMKARASTRSTRSSPS